MSHVFEGTLRKCNLYLTSIMDTLHVDTFAFLRALRTQGAKYIQDLSGGIVDILGGGSTNYSE